MIGILDVVNLCGEKNLLRNGYMIKCTCKHTVNMISWLLGLNFDRLINMLLKFRWIDMPLKSVNPSIKHLDYLWHTHCMFSPVSWGCRIHWLDLWRRVRSLLPNKCPGYDTKPFDGEAPIMLKPWGMWSTPSLPLLPLYPGVVASDKLLSMGQIELLDT